MRDKELKSYMDPAFSDLAWKKMEEVLDRELPVEKKKRRLVVWFWMAAGLALLVAGSIYLFGNDPYMEYQNSTEQPVAFDSNEKVAPSITITDSETLIDHAKADNNLNSEQKIENKSPNTPYISDVTTITPSIKTIEKSATPNPNETQQLITLNDEVPVKKTIKTEDSPKEVIAVPLKPISESVNEIATLAFNKIENKSLPYRFSEKEVSFSRKSIPKSIRFKGYLTGQNSDFGKLQGYEAGIVISKKLAKSKWSFSGGTGFQSEIRTLEIQSAGYIQSDDEAANTDFPSSGGVQDIEFTGQVFVDINGIDSEILADPTNGFQSVYSSKTNSSVNLNVQLYYITFPLKANFHISPRFSFSAGVTPSVYLTGTITDKMDYFPSARNFDVDQAASSLLDNNQSTSIPIANNRYFYFTSTAVAPAKIKRWKFPVHVGIDYQLTKHFGLTIDYKANLSPIIDKDFIKTDLQRFHFGGYWAF
jgi:hypothetical protein